MHHHTAIIATGRYVPDIEVTNAELAGRFAPSEVIAKLEAGSSIRTRYYAPENWCTSDLALRACQAALAKAKRKPEEVDLILLGTDSPDHVTPATSVVLQHKLGATHAGTFDIGCACASFVTGLTVAAGWIAVNPSVRTVLLVGVYQMHKLADPTDPIIFFYGDGAGAVVLERADRPGFIASSLLADGSYAPRWGIYAGGTLEPATEVAVREGRTQVRMVERYPPEVNHLGWPKLVREVAERGGFALTEIDQLFFTQVRKASIELVMDDLGLPRHKAHTIMEQWGYTGSACVPMAFDQAIELGKVKRGDLVVFVGSGVGYNQAAAAFRM